MRNVINNYDITETSVYLLVFYRNLFLFKSLFNSDKESKRNQQHKCWPFKRSAKLRLVSLVEVTGIIHTITDICKYPVKEATKCLDVCATM